MLTISILLFAAVLLVLAAAAARDLRRIDDIVTIVDPAQPDPMPSASERG